ncbi:MAG: STAS domain-containing protein, partial [Candidatus Eiseniibacteriota bacterium]
SARVELHDRPAPPAPKDRGPGRGPQTASPGGSRIARVTLRGSIDAAGAGRLGRALEDLALRDVDQVLLDCAQLRHIDFRRVTALVETLARLDARSGGVVVCGLSRYLRDLFRLAGHESRLSCWSSADDLLGAGPRAPESNRERRS